MDLDEVLSRISSNGKSYEPIAFVKDFPVIKAEDIRTVKAIASAKVNPKKD